MGSKRRRTNDLFWQRRTKWRFRVSPTHFQLFSSSYKKVPAERGVSRLVWRTQCPCIMSPTRDWSDIISFGVILQNLFDKAGTQQEWWESLRKGKQSKQHQPNTRWRCLSWWQGKQLRLLSHLQHWLSVKLRAKTPNRLLPRNFATLSWIVKKSVNRGRKTLKKFDSFKYTWMV